VEKAYRIKRNSEFQKIYKKGKSVALMARLIRFRVTAFPIFLETLMPKRKCSYSLFNVKVHKQDMISKDIIVIARQPAKNMSTLEIQGSLEQYLLKSYLAYAL
jgi:ribonuclease P protein component